MARIASDQEFLSLLPSKRWQTFFKKFNGIDTLPIHEWKPIHLLAYFSERYEQYYGQRFSFSLKGAPSKCPEIFLIKKTEAILGTSNQRIIKDYIDWIFDSKIIPFRKKIKSLGFLANPNFCNEFKLCRDKLNVIERATELPDNYQKIIDELELPLRTYGDLAFAKQAVDISPIGKESYILMFDKLYQMGFEFEMLKELK